MAINQSTYRVTISYEEAQTILGCTSNVLELDALRKRIRVLIIKADEGIATPAYTKDSPEVRAAKKAGRSISGQLKGSNTYEEEYKQLQESRSMFSTEDWEWAVGQLKEAYNIKEGEQE